MALQEHICRGQGMLYYRSNSWRFSVQKMPESSIGSYQFLFGTYYNNFISQWTFYPFFYWEADSSPERNHFFFRVIFICQVWIILKVIEESVDNVAHMNFALCCNGRIILRQIIDSQKEHLYRLQRIVRKLLWRAAGGISPMIQFIIDMGDSSAFSENVTGEQNVFAANKLCSKTFIPNQFTAIQLIPYDKV